MVKSPETPERTSSMQEELAPSLTSPQIDRREFLRIAAILAAGGVLMAMDKKLGPVDQPGQTPTPPPERVPTPMTMMQQEILKHFKNPEKKPGVLYGVTALSEEEIDSYEEDHWDAAKQDRLIQDYHTFVDELDQNLQRLQMVQAEPQAFHLSAAEQQALPQVIEDLQYTSATFEEMAGKDELKAARELHWQRYRKAEVNLEEDREARGLKSRQILQEVNRLRRRAGMPPSSAGRVIKPDMGYRIMATPGVWVADETTTARAAETIQKVETESDLITTVKITNGPDVISPFGKVHLTIQQLSSGNKGNFAEVGTGAQFNGKTWSWSPRVGVRLEGQNFDFIFDREAEDQSNFDNAGVRVMHKNLEGNLTEHIAVIGCVQRTDGRYFGRAYYIEVGTRRLSDYENLDHTEALVGHIIDFAGAGLLAEENGFDGTAVANFTKADGEGFNQRYFVYKENANNGRGGFVFKGVLNNQGESRATQFSEVIGGDPASGEARAGYSDYNQSTGITGRIVRRNVLTDEFKGSFPVMELEKGEIVEELDGFPRPYSLIRYCENPNNPHEFAAIAPVKKDGKVVLKIEIRNDSGKKLSEPIYVPQGDEHQLLADIKFTKQGDLVFGSVSGRTSARMKKKTYVLARDRSPEDKDGSSEDLSKGEWGDGRILVAINQSDFDLGLDRDWIGEIMDIKIASDGEIIERWPFFGQNGDVSKRGTAGELDISVEVRTTEARYHLWLPLILKMGMFMGGRKYLGEIEDYNAENPEQQIKFVEQDGWLIAWVKDQEKELVRGGGLMAKVIKSGYAGQVNV